MQFTQTPAVIPPRNNFDLLRLFLALSVCLSHLGEVSGTSAFLPLANYFYSGIAVDAFFVVSGFLIFRSFQHSSSLVSYLGKRVRRIYPAYVVVVIAASVLLPIFFANNMQELFFSSEWLHYLGYNLLFLNFLQPELPGIFTQNPLQVINAPLWTIKVEVMFYLFVPCIFPLLSRSKRPWLLLTLLYFSSIGYSWYCLNMFETSGNALYLRFEKQLPGQLAFFLSGGGLYLYFSTFKNYWKPLLGCGLTGLILATQHSGFALLFYPFALATVIVCVALLLPYAGNWGKFGDMSYGVYIYHFPIIQVFTARSLFESTPWQGFIMLLLTVFAAAFLSYHCIERPFLKRSSHYRQAAEQLEKQ